MFDAHSLDFRKLQQDKSGQSTIYSEAVADTDAARDGSQQRQPHVVIGLMFFPRGGSSHVTRSLALQLMKQGWKVTIVSGSLRIPGRPDRKSTRLNSSH